MLEVVLDRQIMVILMGIAAAVGVISKIIAAVSLKRLVRASGNMNKSSHPLIRLVKAKFEHACMVSDRVQNVEVFVEKYLYEYRAGGLRLHTWRRLEKAGVSAVLSFWTGRRRELVCCPRHGGSGASVCRGGSGRRDSSSSSSSSQVMKSTSLAPSGIIWWIIWKMSVPTGMRRRRQTG